MQYIAKYHHTLRNVPFQVLNGATVLLIEPEAEDRSFYTNQLVSVNMNVISADALAAMRTLAYENKPDVVVLNPSSNIVMGISSVRELKLEFPSLPVITMSLTMREDHLNAIMESGVSLHINRGLTRPRDLLLALEQVLV